MLISQRTKGILMFVDNYIGTRVWNDVHTQICRVSRHESAGPRLRFSHDHQ